MAEPIVPFISDRGSPEFPRYLIAEPHGQVWSGIVWTGEEREALLFNDSDEAVAECSALLREQCADKPHRAEYVVPLLIEVMSDLPVTKEAVVNWLRQSLVFEIDYGGKGTGPTADSCVLIGLHWSKIENRKEQT